MKRNVSAGSSQPVPVPASNHEAELVESAWSHYSNNEFFRAEEGFQKALETSPNNVDLLYGLGMTYEASNRQEVAIQTFEKVISILKTPQEAISHDRAFMLTRLARGHINRMRTGSWRLEE